MFRKFALVAALSALVLSQAAAAKAPVAQARDIELVLTQQELAVDVPNTGGAVAAGVGGLLGALVGAAINNAQVANGEKRVAEMRNQLIDYRFNQRFEQALTAKLAAANLPEAAKLEVVTSVRGADELKAAGAVPRNYVLVLTPRYAITSNFEDLSVTVGALWVDRTLNAKGKVKQKFVLSRSYAVRFPMQEIAGSGATEDAQRWVALGGTELAAMLDKGIDEVTAMVVYDLTPAGLAESQGKEWTNLQLAGKPRRGRLVEPAPGVHWLRGRFALEDFHPIDGKSAVFSTAAAAAAPGAPVAPVAPVEATATTAAAPPAPAPVAAAVEAPMAADAPAAAVTTPVDAAAPAEAPAAEAATTESSQ
jgi:hypothetical protein